MSREIKFRAWNKANKFMDTVWLIDWEHGQLAHRAHSVSQLENCILMQYTGLKDKNGKEIYEGDIIKYSFRDVGDTNTRVLEIFNDSVNFKMREIFRDYWLEKVDGVLELKHGHLTKYRDETQYLMGISVPEIYSYEVIGNIYENPELLECD